MRRGLFLASVLACCAARSGDSAPISIHLHGEQVDIHAEGVPLVQVLNGVAGEAKMSIVYDNAQPPQDPVSFDIKNATVSEAITELLRGHGLVYVAKMDAGGKRVDTLLLTTGAAGPVHAAPGEPLPNGDPPMEAPPQEYTPEPPPQEIYQPPPTPLTPTAAPASAWTPQPIVMPSSLGGGAVPAATATPPPMMPGRMPGYQGHG